MARDEAPPFERGSTFYNGNTIDANDLGGVNLEGHEWTFEDLDLSSGTVGARPARSNQRVRCRCVRNVSGITLLPKRLVSFKAGDWGKVDGYGRVTGQSLCFPVDEWLPAAGVPNNDLFWVVVEGPATVLTDLAGGAGNVIAQNDPLVALTAATSGATTAGRVQTADFTGATAVLANMIGGIVGRALTARTTAQTNNDVLAYVGYW